jgi:hypothetical protein
MVHIGRIEKFLEMVFWLSRLALEITLDDCDILLIRVIHFLVVVVAMGSDCDLPKLRFCPFLPPLVPWPVALDDATHLPPGAIFALPRTKAAPTASSPEVC